MTSTVQPGRGRLIAARILTTIGTAWSLICLAGAATLMWAYVTEFHSCADFGRQDITTPVLTGLVVSLPGFLLLVIADRLHTAETRSSVSRFVAAAAIAAVVLMVAGTVAPKPGPPCNVRRAQLRNRLMNLATVQEAFMADSHRYSMSLDSIGANKEELNSERMQTTIAWADSASWGAYLVYTDTSPRGAVTRWMCGVFFPDSSETSRPVEGIGPLRNGCWDPKRR